MNSTLLLILSIAMTGVVMLSGYFYGRLLQKVCGLLDGIDCTFLGVFTILALFQIEIFWSYSTGVSTSVAALFVIILLIAGPVLALIFRTDLKPQKYHGRALLTGLAVTVVLTIASIRLNLNSVFFDTITYLSEVIESAEASTFGHMNYNSGDVLIGIDAVHDFTGYYYFWGMLLRNLDHVFHIQGSLTPIYIWGGTFLYSMALGELIYNSAALLSKKDDWKVVLVFSMFILMPYFTNYYNSTLAFFGNTFRTVATGWAMLLAYLIILKKNAELFLPLAITYYANICFTSSGFFLDAFVTAGLLFSLGFRKANNAKVYRNFILSCIPIVHYALVILKVDLAGNYLKTMIITAGIIAVMLLVLLVVKNHLQGFNGFLRVLCFIAVVGLIGASFLAARNGTFGYSRYFMSGSQNDMLVNITSHTSTAELLRNLILYAMIVCLFFTGSRWKSLKRLLVILFALFMNPLTQPAVSTYMTSEVYHRTFDLLLNPFVLTFLVASLHSLITSPILNKEILSLLSFVSLIFGMMNIMNYYSRALAYKDIGWDWKLKASPDSYDMYHYIQNNIADAENRPSILSQDVNLKGYVTDIALPFTSTDYRETIADPAQYADQQDLVKLLYPNMRYTDQNLFEDGLNYDALPQIILDKQADYLLISNVTSVWNAKGWYDKVYLKMIDSGLCEMTYQNDTWALLKINKDYQVSESEG
ncbi:MAG: hypothetical protein VZT48_04380 [Bulleidia sp.]|nr:hypothetical protein [Bulleidia sp.]